MRSERLVERWTGVALTLVGVVAVLALAATGRLTLYIHPRYTVFTVAMAVLGGAAVVAALVLRPHEEGEGHGDGDHDHAPDAAPRSRWRTAGRLAAVAAAVLALLVLPPATLSGDARQNRDLVTSSRLLGAGGDTVALAGADPSTFSVKDWAVLLRQGGASAVVGKKVDLSGYVLDRGDPDVFYVARLMMSCCAVDAQAVGIPVARRQWRDELEPGAWVALTGSFVPNPDVDSSSPTVITPTTLVAVDEPEQPYVF